MNKIAVDIDQTLFDFDSEVREAFFEMAIEEDDKSLLKGAYSGFNEWRELADAHDWRIIEQAIDLVHSRQYEQTPYKGAKQTLDRLSDAGYEIIYVTSRKEKFREETDAWLAKYEFPYDGLICSTHDKSPHLKDCRYLIDDRPKTIVAFLYDYKWTRNHGENYEPRKAFGLWTPYNRNLTDIKNVYLAPTWKGIEYYMERKGIL